MLGKVFLIFIYFITPLLSEDIYKTIQRPYINIQKFKKVALVIGNKDYQESPLINSIEDARAIRDFLIDKNFQKIVYAENADELEMKEKVREFLNSLDKNSLGFVYFSGHGIQESGVNYLIPIDNSKLQSITDLKYHTISLNYILDSLSEKDSGFNIVLLDACRTPFKAFGKSVKKGLYSSSAKGVYIAYATADGERTLDDGLFRKSFIKNAKKPLKLIDIFEKVKMEIYNKTGETPFIYNGKRGEFYFTLPNNDMKISNVDIEQDNSPKYYLRIDTKPRNANIKIVNINHNYNGKVLLKKGFYKIYISAVGYKDKEFLIELDENSRYEIKLEKDKKNISTSNGIIFQNQKFTAQDVLNYDSQVNGKRVMSWQRAKKYCRELDLDNFEWRLPTKNELKTLISTNANISNSGYRYFIKKEFVNNMPPLNGKYHFTYFWTSTEYGISDAWHIDFARKNRIRYRDKNVRNYVMCVRDKPIKIEKRLSNNTLWTILLLIFGTIFISYFTTYRKI